MKTIKALRLSMMNRPFVHEGRSFLAVTTIAMIKMDEASTLVPEPEMWQLLRETLGEDATVDLAMPKVRPEYLVSGSAYAPEGRDGASTLAQVRLGTKEKSVCVYGDRYWLGGQATTAQRFVAQPLGWAFAYGGPGYPANPAGRGAQMEEVQGVHVRRLPNIERADSL